MPNPRSKFANRSNAGVQSSPRFGFGDGFGIGSAGSLMGLGQPEAGSLIAGSLMGFGIARARLRLALAMQFLGMGSTVGFLVGLSPPLL